MAKVTTRAPQQAAQRGFQGSGRSTGQQFGASQPSAYNPWDLIGNAQKLFQNPGQQLSSFGDWAAGPQSPVGQVNNALFGPQSLAGQIGQIGSGLVGATVRDANGQGLPTTVQPDQIGEIMQRLQASGIPLDQQQSIIAGLQNGRYASPEDVLNEIESYRQEADYGRQVTGAVAGLGSDQRSAIDRLNSEEAEFLGPDSYLSQTYGRLNQISGDPAAISRDRDYAPIFANILNQTASMENQQRRQASQRSAGRGVSGAGGSALAQTLNAQALGANQRADTFRNVVGDVSSRLSGLDNARREASSTYGNARDNANRYYGGEINRLNMSNVRDPYDFGGQAENRVGATTYNQGLQAAERDRLLGLVSTGLGVGQNLISTAANTIKIPGMK